MHVAQRFESPFGAIRHPGTEELYTDTEVARMSARMRTRNVPDPTVSQVAALAANFGVATAYLVDRGEEQLVLGDEVLDAP